MDENRARQIEQLIDHYQEIAESARRLIGQPTDSELADAATRARRGNQLATSLPVLFQILGNRLPRVFRSSRTEESEEGHHGHQVAWIATLPHRALQVDIDQRTAHVGWRFTLDEQPTDWQSVDGVVVTDEQLQELIDLLGDQHTWGAGYVPRCSFGVYTEADDEELAPVT